MFALRERRIHVTQEDFEMAVGKVRPTFLIFTFHDNGDLGVMHSDRIWSAYVLSVWSQFLFMIDFLTKELKEPGAGVRMKVLKEYSNNSHSFFFVSGDAKGLGEEYVDQKVVEVN